MSGEWICEIRGGWVIQWAMSFWISERMNILIFDYMNLSQYMNNGANGWVKCAWVSECVQSESEQLSVECVIIALVN